jgi:eukaryotic-like serine/threonine-protein kinase
VASLDTAERKLLMRADSQVLYSQGHLLFLRETTLMAQPFDAQRLVLTGDAFPIAEQIQTESSQVGVFSASENGVLAYQTGMAASGSQLTWFDRAGKQLGVLGDPAAQGDVQLSPDGKQAAVSIQDPARQTSDIWIYDVARNLKTRFTFDPADELALTWSPDGKRVVFNSSRKGHLDLYQKAADRSGTEALLFEDNLGKWPASWSPDGSSLYYFTLGATNNGDWFVLPLTGERKPVPFIHSQFNETFGQLSPDGRWLAYTSNESGRGEVYVVPVPGPGGKRQVSNGGGGLPRWRRDGTELFYLDSASPRKLMAAAVNGKGASFEVGAVKPLFETHGPSSRYFYDVSPNGQRFLIISVPQAASAAPVTVVVNWTAGLKK